MNRHFAEINRAALAAFPAVLARILPGGKRIGAEVVALNPRCDDRRVGSFKVNRYNGRWADFATGVGRRSDFACRLSRRRVAGRSSAAARPNVGDRNPEGLAMADGIDFAPLSGDERDAAAQELGRDGEPGADNPASPPAGVEAADVAAARLFGRPPDMAWRYSNADGEPVFFVCRWNTPDGDKDIRPLSWFGGEGWRFAHWPDARALSTRHDRGEARRADCHLRGREGSRRRGAHLSQSVATTSSGGAQAAARTDWTPLAG